MFKRKPKRIKFYFTPRHTAEINELTEIAFQLLVRGRYSDVIDVLKIIIELKEDQKKRKENE